MNSVTTVTQPTSWRRSERSPQRSLTCTSTWIITVSSFYLSRARGSKVLMKTLTAYLFIYLFFKISPTMRRKSWFICEAPSLCFTKVTSASIKDQLFRDCNTEQHKLSVCVCVLVPKVYSTTSQCASGSTRHTPRAPHAAWCARYAAW